jgi:peptidoglycan hydrolase CwlO-like protein
MTGEEMERAIAFILEQQAQFAANQEQAVERISRLEAAQESLAQTQENTERQIGRLSEALIELTDSHTRTQDALARLAEAQAHSDQRLDALIDIVQSRLGNQP